jgi:hypothetical protein
MQIDPARFATIVPDSVNLMVVSIGARRKRIGKSVFTHQEQHITTMRKWWV